MRVLIIEDEPDVAGMLRRVVLSCGAHEVHILNDAAQFDRAWRQWPAQVVFTDLLMPGVDGFAVLDMLRRLAPEVPVIVVSAHATLANAVQAVKAGAFDFLAKPFSPEGVDLVLTKVLSQLSLLRRHALALDEAMAGDATLAALVGEHPSMQQLRQAIVRLRVSRANVLLEGESGTGKELVARAIHGGRGPFVAVNMAALSESLAESELFGHCRGAFSGAVRDHTGLIAQAQGGVLLMDETNSMPLPLQAKLLRALQERHIRPVGATRELPVDFQLLAAINRPAQELLDCGALRQDLFYRLAVVRLRLPPLRERRDDIAPIAQQLMQRYARAHGRHVRQLSADALRWLAAQDWPGNVRELENRIEQAVVLMPDGTDELDAELLRDEPQADSPPASEPWPPLQQVELRYIREVLRHCGNNKAQAARMLNVDYKTLLRKLVKLTDEEE